MAGRILSDVKRRVLQSGKKVKFAIIRVGNNKASKIYINIKKKRAKECSIGCDIFEFDKNVDEGNIIEKIKELNSRSDISGIILQRPLPKKFHTHVLQDIIDPKKDIDCLSSYNQGLLFQNKPYILPPTPRACMMLISQAKKDINGMHAVIVGRSEIVGKPLAIIMLHQNATVTIAHSNTNDLKKITKEADILVSGVGKKGLITKNHVKNGAIVIDVGISKEKDTIYGDVCFDEVIDHAQHISPVPNGVGPLTVACLLENVLTCAGIN